MSYFTDPQSIEELKQQCRHLLIKYDYKSGKNSEIIKEIYAEYQQRLNKMNREAGNYRSLSELASDGAKTLISEIKEVNAIEAERVNRLKNHTYTAEELKELISTVKQYIKKIICYSIESNKSYYQSVMAKKEYGTEYVTRWFNLNSHKLSNTKLKEEYDIAREKLEYAMKSQAKTKGDEETYMVQMERALGKYIVTIFDTEVANNIDPIDIVSGNINRENAKTKNKKDFFWFMKVDLIASGAAFILCALNGAAEIGLIFFIISFILISILYGIGWVITKLILKLFTTGSGYGEMRKKSRVSERDGYYKDKIKGRIGKIVIGIIAFLLICEILGL